MVSHCGRRCMLVCICMQLSIFIVKSLYHRPAVAKERDLAISVIHRKDVKCLVLLVGDSTAIKPLAKYSYPTT